MAEIGSDKHRKEAWQKVTGEAKYTDDFSSVELLHARLATSPHAHARILGINTKEALAIPGVKLVLTGADCPSLSGPLLCDRPPMAKEFVRYAGEPVALVVAQDEATAALAAEKIAVAYQILPAVFDPYASFTTGKPLLHKSLADYARMVDDVYPRAGSNVSSYYPIRKGNMDAGFGKSEYTVSREFHLPPSGHIAMELRTARAQINHDGTVEIVAASQSPYEVAQQIADCFGISAGSVRVRVPFVGGAFGGKAPAMLELLAHLASRRLGGRAVRLAITRHEDMASLPCRVGLWANIKLGADKDGKIRAGEFAYILDNGAYADIGPYMAKAVAVDCTGPYNIENLSCDVYSVYTNHTYATSYRGYAHESYTFCIERAIDELARRMNIDALELRRINAIRPGDLTPTQVTASLSNVGNLEQCIDDLKAFGGWSGIPQMIDGHRMRAMGCACFWKAPTPPIGAASGAVVTVNSDGTFQLTTGVVEMGSGGQSLLAQMLAERLRIPTEQVHVDLAVDTSASPEHYKTVASFTTYMAGHAVLRAADDIIAQIRQNAAPVLGCTPEEIEIGGGRAFVREEPERYVLFQDILSGCTIAGEEAGDLIIGRGGYMLKGITPLDTQTGKGRTAPSWTVGAQLVEVELDLRDCSYRILDAYTVMDIGKVLNPAEQESMVKGGMAMGLSMASREAFHYQNGSLATPTLRTYKLLHFSEAPQYHVAFVETPQDDAPYGTRPMSEHGIIGMPAALANALSSAAGVAADMLPVTPEALWKARTGGSQ